MKVASPYRSSELAASGAFSEVTDSFDVAHGYSGRSHVILFINIEAGLGGGLSEPVKGTEAQGQGSTAINEPEVIRTIGSVRSRARVKCDGGG